MNNVCTLLEEHLHGMQRLEWRQCARWLPVWPGNSISERRASVWKGGEEVSNGLRLRKKDGIDYRNRFSSGLIHAEFFLFFFYPSFFYTFFYSDRFEGVLNFRSFVTHCIGRKSHSRTEIYVNLGLVMRYLYKREKKKHIKGYIYCPVFRGLYLRWNHAHLCESSPMVEIWR